MLFKMRTGNRPILMDFAIFEVGLEERLDATNVVEPLVSVITNSGYNHMDKLGSRLTSIARKQAGIIKCPQTLYAIAEKLKNACNV